MKLITIIKDGESIEKALKRFKKKFDKTRVIKELRLRQQYIKPSQIRRAQIIRAKYRQQMKSKEEE